MKSAATPTVEFPAFCVGNSAAVRQRVSALGKKLAARYRESGGFLPLDLVPVQPGSLIFTESAFDLGQRPGVRIYLVPELLSAAQSALGWADSAAVESVFESEIRGSCWGVLASVTGRRRPDTVGSLRGRVDALLPCWSTLDQFRFVDKGAEAGSLAQLVQSRFAGLMTMWLQQPTGDTPRDLSASMAALEAADAPARLEAAVARLVQLAAINQRVKHKQTLTDPDFIRRKLSGRRPDELEAMEVGTGSAALTFLYGTDRELGEGGAR